MPASRRSFNSIFTSLARVLKATDAEALRDLEDALGADAPIERDVGIDPHYNPRGAASPTGRPQDMSGEGTRMVAEFSDFAEQHQKMVRDYDEMSRRLTATEKMLKALAGFTLAVAKAAGTVDDDAEPEEEKEEKEEEQDETAKAAGLPSLNMAQFFTSLTPRSPSRATGKGGLATPPDMNGNAIAKAVTIGDRIDCANLSAEHNVAALTILQAMGAEAQGLLPRGTTQAHLSRAPLEVRDLFTA